MKAKAAAATAVLNLNPPLISFDHKRDAYGFAVRPQHLQRYREYANIYKEEEEERSERWKDFLQRQSEAAQLPVNGLSSNDQRVKLGSSLGKENADIHAGANYISSERPCPDGLPEDAIKNVPQGEEILTPAQPKAHGIQIWSEIRSSIHAIDHMMSFRVKKKISSEKNEQDVGMGKPLPPIEEARPVKGGSEEDSEDEFYDLDRSESDSIQEVPITDNFSVSATISGGDPTPLESLIPWKEELECLVQGGVPMALRGELWQAFVGVRARRVENYYQDLLVSDAQVRNGTENGYVETDSNEKDPSVDPVPVPEKWKGQIEKDLPRTFPGHPALDEDGRNALRRLLTAYARHNPAVGYCQTLLSLDASVELFTGLMIQRVWNWAMNFFAGLLLLLMPEENAFWTLMGILDDYFDGYYSEEMIESQVDQLVLEELVREKLPKLVNHLDYLGVQVAWVTGPWFLSIFMNMLPWESVLRVWDVLLFQGNRVMLFRTALALMELYGPALVTTKDAGDAVTLLQSLAGSTFDSSQLVLTACMGFQNVSETRLHELRNKHRPSVKASIEERSKGLQAWKDSKGLASKLYSFKHDPGSMMTGTNKLNQTVDSQIHGEMSHVDTASTNANELYANLAGDVEIDSVPDLKEQVVWLKVELCKLLEEKRSAELRSEELETALMEMVKQDNRRQLSAKVEQLEQEVTQLQQALADKQEQENAMLQVLMRVEQEQKVTEDARRFAEQDAAAQRYAAQVLQEKYEEATVSLADMEKRVIMAESMLEATLQYQSGQNKAQPSPRSSGQQDASPEIPTRKISLLSRPFGLGWRDKNKGKPTNAEESNDSKSMNDAQSPRTPHKETNGIEVENTV